MALEFSCTQCGRPLHPGDATPGTRVLCPACGTFSTVAAPAAGAPIEFRCTGCNKLLRTAADTAGKQARCPECGAVVPVPGPEAGVSDETLPYLPSPGPPTGETASPFAPDGQSAPVGDPENPYLAPTQYGQPPPQPWAGVDPTAASRVSGPAVALIVTGALGIALQAVGIVGRLLQFRMGMPPGGPPNMPMFFAPGVYVITGGITIALGIVVIVGAVKMKNLQSYAFAMTAAIIAMVPCVSPCCLLGLPFGIWALVVLSDAGVKAAFRG